VTGEGLEASVEFYNRWVEEVKRTVPAGTNDINSLWLYLTEVAIDISLSRLIRTDRVPPVFLLMSVMFVNCAKILAVKAGTSTHPAFFCASYRHSCFVEVDFCKLQCLEQSTS
jgi:hypothetical protein